MASQHTFSAEEFEFLLSDESCVDIERLREATKYGCPYSVRGEVWKILLGVAQPDRSEEMTTRRRIKEQYQQLRMVDARTIDDRVMQGVRSEILNCQKRAELEYSKRGGYRSSSSSSSSSSRASGGVVFSGVGMMEKDSASHSRRKSDIGRQKRVASYGGSGNHQQQQHAHRQLESMAGDFFRKAHKRMRFERLLTAYLAHNSSLLPKLPEHNWTMLMAPVFACMEDSADIYFCFLHLIKSLDQHRVSAQLERSMADFMMLFRTFQADLCGYFEDEELNPNEWAIHWLTDLLASALPLSCVMRLWDTYFASEKGFGLHIYVCLAILITHAEDLMELEYTELRLYLRHLPHMDMAQIITQATTLMEEATAKGYLHPQRHPRSLDRATQRRALK